MTTPYRYGQVQKIRELPPDSMAPVIGWDDFMDFVFDWKQDEHVGLIGPTGSGKSTLTYAILPKRKYIVFFATKPQDKVLAKFADKAGFVRTEEYPPKTGRIRKRAATPDEVPRRLLWPDATTLGSVDRQRKVFGEAFEQVYSEGGWCVVWDEFWMMTSILKLEKEARIMLQQARANGMAFVMGAQRPSRIPLELFDQASHLFFWKDNDEVNLNRIGGVGWLSSGPIRAFVANLEPHQVLYVHTRKGWMYRTTAPEVK